MKKNKLVLGLIPYGVVVLAEPGLSPEEMRKDLENIRSLHFNTIVLYPSVSRWEGNPPGQTAFAAIDRIMDWCAELGLKVVLELQGQVMQDQDAPECFRLPAGYPPENYRENGFHQPEKEALLRRYLREVTTHFKGHPALLAYDLFNEIGNDSRSPETVQAFIAFLRRHYHDDVQELNRAWATYFPEFETIATMPPHYGVWSWSSVVAERDWQRFRSQDFTGQIAWWRSLVREVDPVTPLFVDVLGSDVLHNRTDSYFGVSDWDAVEQSDILGLSCYANMLAADWWNRDAWLWPQFWRHALSVAKGRQTIISELMTQNRSLFPLEKSSMTDEISLWSYQAVFHGIQGLIYWKYRPFRRGRQVGGRGLTDFAGEPNHFARQASEVASFVERHAGLLAGSHPDDAGCAIVHDPETERLYTAIGVGANTGTPSSFYTDSHRGWFRALWTKGVSPSYLTPACLTKGVPERIRVLVLPGLATLSEALSRSLTAFMERGGLVVVESRFGTLDEDGNLWSHSPGTGLHAVTGIEEKNFTARFRDKAGSLSFHDDYFQELTVSPAAHVIARTEGGLPALVESRVGRGRYLHFPFLLGHKVEQEASSAAALTFFQGVWDQIRPALTPRIEVVQKPERVDVSVLVDDVGNPTLVGVCNYQHEAVTVTLGTSLPGKFVVGEGSARMRQDGARLVVELPARSSAAVVFHTSC